MKRGALYDDIKRHFRPFDAVFFKGSSLFSRVISRSQMLFNDDPNSGDFTHVGMIVNSDILEHPNVLKGKLYILESTIGGHFGLDVYDINGRSIIGVQLRDLDEVVRAYDVPNNTTIAYGKLIANPINKLPGLKLKEMFTIFFNEVNGKMYNGNICDMMAAFIPYIRGYREFNKYVTNSMCPCMGGNDKYFCSELIALAYVITGVYPENINIHNVMPRDIAMPWCDTDTMPTIMESVTPFVTSTHYQHGSI